MSSWNYFSEPVFWILAITGIACIFVFISRLLDLRRAQIDFADFIRGVTLVLDRGNADEAIAICDDTIAPVARIVGTAIRHRDGSARVQREAVDNVGRSEVARLERRLAVLAIVAQGAPLLGLIGTIIGMMHVILSLNTAELVTRADLLGGTMQSLVSAAAGLIVALSVQVMYGMVHVRLDRLTVDLEAAASEILAHLAALREAAHEG